MEYALLALFYILKTLFNTLMNFRIVQGSNISVSSVVVACVIIMAVFKGLGFAKDSINREMAMRMLMSKLVELKEQEHKENLKELKGDFSQITWGSQIRSYVFHPYTMVKDHRTGAEVGTVDKVLDGDLDYFINEKLKQKD